MLLDPKVAGVYHLNLTASKNSKLTGAILENPDWPVKMKSTYLCLIVNGASINQAH